MRKLTILILKATIFDQTGVSWIKDQLEKLSNRRVIVSKSAVFIKESTLEALSFNVLKEVDYIIITGYSSTKATLVVKTLFLIGNTDEKAYLNETQEKNISSRIIKCLKKDNSGNPPRSDNEKYVHEGIALLFYPYPGEDELLINHLLNYNTNQNLFFNNLITWEK